MLHEYIHSIGALEEAQARQLVYEISKHYFGETHTITKFASDIGEFIPNLSYPIEGYQPPQDANIEFVKGIDIKNTNYIN